MADKESEDTNLTLVEKVKVLLGTQLHPEAMKLAEEEGYNNFDLEMTGSWRESMVYKDGQYVLTEVKFMQVIDLDNKKKNHPICRRVSIYNPKGLLVQREITKGAAVLGEQLRSDTYYHHPPGAIFGRKMSRELSTNRPGPKQYQ